MRIKRTIKTKRVITTAIILAVIVAGGLYAYFSTRNPIDESVRQEQMTDNQNKQEFIDNHSKDVQANTEVKVPDNTDNIVVSASQEKDGSVTIMTKLIGYSDGECSLFIKNGSSTATQKALVIFQSEYSTCAGFSVAKSDLGAGKWNVELTVTSKGKSLMKSTSLEVM